jgi:glutathione S-transferase
LGIQDSVEIIKIDLQSQDVVGYRDTVHPHATLPALQLEDGSVMLESAAICLYLAESFLDPEGYDLLPDEEHSAHYYE